MQGLDAHFDRQLAEHHAKHDADEVWQERVDERAEELRGEDPDLEWEEARDHAAEALRREDEQAAGDEAERQAENIAADREYEDAALNGRMA